jgi:hypothetical protein
MERMRKNWWKAVLMILGCLVLDIAGHRLGPRLVYENPSLVFENQTLFIPLIAGLFVVTFGALGAVFVWLQSYLPGSRLAKGLRYGLAFGGLWFVAMPVMTLLFDSPLAQELYTGMVDGGTVVLMSLLLGLSMGVDSKAGLRPRRDLAAIPAVAAFFFVGQHLTYLLPGVPPLYATRPWATLLCTAALSIWVGFVYWFLGPGLGGRNPWQKALYFGGLVFGVDWLLYSLFALLFVETSWVLILAAAGLNIISVVLGVWVYEKLAGNRLLRPQGVGYGATQG